MARLLMSTDKKTHIAARFEVWRSVVQVQRWFKGSFGKNNTLSANTIKLYHKNLFETGCASNSKRPNRRFTKRTEVNIHIVE